MDHRSDQTLRCKKSNSSNIINSPKRYASIHCGELHKFNLKRTYVNLIPTLKKNSLFILFKIEEISQLNLPTFLKLSKFNNFHTLHYKIKFKSNLILTFKLYKIY